MKSYEALYLIAEPFLPSLGRKVRSDLKKIIQLIKSPVKILDVGGRMSPCTIGLSARVTLVDLPRTEGIQKMFNLGLDKEMIRKLKARRTNIDQIICEDIMSVNLRLASFDVVTAIEVLEHIPDDQAFVKRIYSFLRPGGRFYIATPNGDYIKKPSSSSSVHLRHYTRHQLNQLLLTVFPRVDVEYGIKTGRWRVKGLRHFSGKHPLKCIESCFCNVISHLESRRQGSQVYRTAHLFARAKKM